MKRIRGFTLVELLVVIGIIALLIGILLPALNAAREHSKTITCLSNLRQMGIAARIYANAYNGSLPIAQYSGNHAWDFEIVTDPVTSLQSIRPGILWLGRGSIQIQQCPSCEIKSPTVSDPFTGYNYNTSFLGHGMGEFRSAPAKFHKIHRAAETAMFGDGQYWGGTNKFMRAPVRENPVTTGDSISTITRSAGTQGFRHRGKTNVCYVDGHAASLAERFTAVNPAVAAGTGFLSNDNRAYDGRP